MVRAAVPALVQWLRSSSPPAAPQLVMIGCQINCVADADVALHLRHRSGVQQASSEDSGLRTLPPRKVYRMPTYFQTGATLVVVAVAVLAAFEIQPRVDLPDVTLGHPVNYFDNLLTPQQGDALRGLIHDMGRFPTNVQDVRFYKTTHEHIGEVCVGVQIPHLSWPSLTLALCSACALLRSPYRRSPLVRMACASTLSSPRTTPRRSACSLGGWTLASTS